MYIYPEKKVLLHNHKNIVLKLTLKDFDARKSEVSLVHSNHTNTSEPQPSPATPWCGPLYPHQHQRAPAFASYNLMCSILTTATSESHTTTTRGIEETTYSKASPLRGGASERWSITFDGVAPKIVKKLKKEINDCWCFTIILTWPIWQQL